jgi:hypothetical protein
MRWHRLLLLLPLLVLWVPFYDRAEPSIGGVPFFYWYQMAWIAVTVVVIAVVHRRDAGRAP